MDNEDYKRSFPIKFKVKENINILKFANMQKNFQDSVRYLIEKEIAENGIRNLQLVIPVERDLQYFEKLFSNIQPFNKAQEPIKEKTGKEDISESNLPISNDIIKKVLDTDTYNNTINKEGLNQSIKQKKIEKTNILSCYDD